MKDNPSDHLRVQIMDVNKEKVRVFQLGLGIKPRQQNPWENIEARYPPDIFKRKYLSRIDFPCQSRPRRPTHEATFLFSSGDISFMNELGYPTYSPMAL